MRIVSAALAASLSFALLSSSAAQTAAPNPTPRPPPGLGQPPGPGPGDVVPAPDLSPLPGPPPNAVGAAPAGPAPATPKVQFTKAQQLDQLFELLRVAPNSDAATAVERRISALWTKSGSDTIDLLTKWADNAIEAKDYALALDYLARITTLKPDYVEGWDKRANVFFLMEDFGRSLADLEHVLALEPRHFGALAGLGTILHAIGEDQKALVAYKRALEIDPNLDAVKDAIESLHILDAHI